MKLVDLTPEVDLTQIRMAIYWKMLGELDIYTSGKVRTVTGAHVDLLITALRNQHIPIEIME